MLRYTPVVPAPVDVSSHVLANHRLSDLYNVIELEAPDIGRSSQPGQFVMVKTAVGRTPLLRRPFSVFEVLRDSCGTVTGVSLLSKRVGTVTDELHTLEPGDRLQCLGPLGKPFTIVGPPTRALMVAGGVGLAPFATLAEQLRARGTDTTLFYGGRTKSDLYYVELFEQLGVEICLVTEDGTRGEKGRVTKPLEKRLHNSKAQSMMVYACGPTPMMHVVSTLAGKADQPTEVSLEPVMGCGLGGCYSCVVRVVDDGSHFVRSCLEGPVFRSERLSWSDLI